MSKYIQFKECLGPLGPGAKSRTMWQRRTVDMLFQAKCQDWQTRGWYIAWFQVIPPSPQPGTYRISRKRGQYIRVVGDAKLRRTPPLASSLLCFGAASYIPRPYVLYICIILIILNMIYGCGVAGFCWYQRHAHSLFATPLCDSHNCKRSNCFIWHPKT